MKEREIYDAITNLPDELINEADEGWGRKRMQKKSIFSRKFMIASVAACLVVVLIGVGIAGSVDKRKMTYGDMLLLQINYPTSRGRGTDDAFETGVNKFAYETVSQIFTSQEGNINYSPVSLYMSLGMAATGADGELSDSLHELLNVSSNDKLLEQCQLLYSQLYKNNEGDYYRCLIHNSIWVDEKLDIKKDYVKTLAGKFYAQSFEADFSDEITENAMEQWVSDTTNGIIEPDVELTANTVMTLMNTVYFYDEWQVRFDEELTKEDLFYLEDGTSVVCDFMNMDRGAQAFWRGENYIRAQLDLKSYGSVVFILPEEGVSPRELLATPESVQEVFEGGEIKTGEVIWKIPKFSFGTKLSFKEALQELGLEDLFNESAAFGNITDDMAYISDIAQDTHIAIDEKGIEAASYTQITFYGAPKPEDNAEMILDRPFIYAIKDNHGTIIFVGIIDNPTAE